MAAPNSRVWRFKVGSVHGRARMNGTPKPSILQIKLEKPAPPDSIEADFQKAVPNLPFYYWTMKTSRKRMNQTCANYPPFYKIRYNNGRWQILSTSMGNLYLFGAYYDSRTLADGPVVRILGMVDHVVPQVSIFCQFWLTGQNTPVFANVSRHDYIWKTFSENKESLLRPCLLSCQVPAEHTHLVPESVSLVERPCDDATTNLRVVNNHPPQGQMQDFAVCVKGLDIQHEDKSVYLVEWLETLYLLGANKVFLYDLQVHPNTTKVLNYYQEAGFVDLSKLTLPGDQPNIPELSHMYLQARSNMKRLNELIPYNDCLYRNIYSYKYVVVIDIDELIIPKNFSSWKTMMEVMVERASKENSRSTNSFVARNVYFLDSMLEGHGFFRDVPQYMHILQHVYRARNYTSPRRFVKGFHDTQLVFTLHNHYPYSCLGRCYSYSIPTEDAQLQHYRRNCISSLRALCENEFKRNTVLDKTIWRYKEQLIERVSAALENLGFFETNTR
ncbi:uncharacterized protein LOC122244299 [Penaeus japonicus]|uniref:uncharacterized protein LOC122244299 n=1 Tax=Penaeus japonicus TaxID=27405 RepID=UPI001C711821|nr:uncharacterized protein LOC122244299 [Penaeus japonicus]